MFTQPLGPSFACLPACAAILLSGNCACVSAGEIFAQPAVLAQPFDKAPFHAVQVPEWVQNTLGAGYTLSGMDTAQRERAAAAGVTLSEMGFVDPFFTYYPSKLLERRSPHVPPERRCTSCT